MKSPQKNHPAGPRCPTRRGFALIVVLSLMVLLTILALGMLTLSTVEMRSKGIGTASQKAEANARLAVMMAICELQGELGPDRRISAPGGQLLEETDTSSRKHWTGVYEAWAAETEARPAPVFRKWLISGNDAVVTAMDAVTNGAALADETETLVSAIPAAGGALTVASDAVDAGVIRVEDGAYAWWVGDNHLKAKVGHLSPTPVDEKEALADMQAAPQPLPETFIGDGIDRNDPRIERLISVASVNLLSASDDSLFHHVTTRANGLVTNVRAGGFRKDLSFILQKPFAEVNKDPLYTAGATPGINFRELWADYNIWGELQTSGLPAHADGSSLPAGTPFLASPSTFATAYDDPFRSYRQPTRIRHSIAYSMISRPKAGSPTEYELFLVVDPLVTLWNPFNVPYHLPSGAYNTFQNWAIPYRLTLAIQKPTGTVNWSANVSQISGTGFNQTRVARGQSMVMRPGEVQVLSQSYRDQINPGGTIDAKLGWNFGSGFAYSLTVPKKDSNGVVTDPNGLGLPVINGDDVLTFSLEPTGNGQSHGLALTLSRQFIGEELISSGGQFYRYPNGNFSIDWTTIPEGNRDGNLAANGHLNIFRRIENDASYSKRVADMNSPVGATDGAAKKWPLFDFTMDVRTERDAYAGEVSSLPPTGTPVPRFTSRAMLSMNPKAFAYDLGNLSAEYLRETPIQVSLRKLTSLNNVIDTGGVGLGFFGASHKADGNSYVVTHAIPRSPIFSLGAMQHSVANGAISNQEVEAKGSNFSRVWYLRPSIAHPISNSFAPSVMPKDATAITRGQGTKYLRDLADHSFLVNRAIWDGYFFSSISPKTTTAHRNSATAYSEQKQLLTSFMGSGGSQQGILPNSRMKPWGHDSEKAVDDIFDGDIPKPDAADRTAAHLVVDGAFNVNSTSIAAWKSMLGALKGSTIPVRSPTAGPNAALTAVDDTPVANLLPPAGGEISKPGLSDPGNPDQWLGFRTLNEAEIEELATAIVAQVRLRGPFTSLADFINRRPGNDDETALSGALQSALDDPSVSINEPYRDGDRSLGVAEATSQGFAFPEAAAGPKSAGAPGYVKQGDLLTPLGPLITVRGDTFTIRAYGDARDKDGTILSKAWCEATVQRTPEYVDPADDAHLAIPNSPANQRFGRKFEIVSFRFLQEEEL